MINNGQRNRRTCLACIVEPIRSENLSAVFVMFTEEEERPTSDRWTTIFTWETPQIISSKP